ncbi:MAG: hypothetical protein R6T96_03495 [Longimicrobiales bacterium]
MKIHKNIRPVLVAMSVALLVGACDQDFMVPNYNNPAREDLTGSPTQATIAAAVQGIVRTHRGLKAGMVRPLGVWGREGYDLRPEEPRPFTDALIDPIDPVNGGNFFSGQYTQITQINTVLEALERSPLSDTQRRAVAGFVKTIKADTYWQAAIARVREVGLPLDPNPDPNGELTPISSKSEVWAYVNALYDEARSDLQAGGGSFPFQLPPGFEGFDTPAQFVQVNRALKAVALKYQGDWAGTLQALQGSFLDPGAAMDFGVKFDYSTISGDASNGFFTTPYHHAHPRVREDAQLQEDGSVDQRVQDKLRPEEPFTLFEVTVVDEMDVYKSLTDPLPWVTNDLLLLVRAEARLASNQRGEALADVNLVRTLDGNLPALPTNWSGDVLDEILYNKLLSLLWEGGFQYFDYRQYDMLDELPRARPNHGVYPGYPYPINECLARDIMDQVECSTYFAG